MTARPQHPFGFIPPAPPPNELGELHVTEGDYDFVCIPYARGNNPRQQELLDDGWKGNGISGPFMIFIRRWRPDDPLRARIEATGS
jgi:hypothetical protein